MISPYPLACYWFRNKSYEVKKCQGVSHPLILWRHLHTSTWDLQIMLYTKALHIVTKLEQISTLGKIITFFSNFFLVFENSLWRKDDLSHEVVFGFECLWSPSRSHGKFALELLKNANFVSRQTLFSISPTLAIPFLSLQKSICTIQLSKIFQ